MGFDIYGIEPKQNTIEPKILGKDWQELNDKQREQYFEAKEKHETENPGRYFRNNVWWWRPLWAYVCSICEDVMTEEEQLAGTDNSGNTIPESTTERMVEKLVIEIALDNHIKHAEQYKKEVEALPDEECWLCKGTGKRDDEHVKGECNACGGKGTKTAWEASYPFDPENVEQFINFLSESGGIQVY
jgi:DnaJ-class molecular chaperone